MASIFHAPFFVPDAVLCDPLGIAPRSAANGRDSSPAACASLIDAAIAAFGRAEFDAVGADEIADAAGLDPSEVLHHFSSSHALHQAAAAVAVERVLARSREPSRLVRTALSGANLPERAKTRIVRSIAYIALGFLDEAEVGLVFRFLHGEWRSPSLGWNPAIEAALVAHAAIAAMLGLALDEAVETEAVRMTAPMLLAQRDAFVSARRFANSQLGWDDLDEAETSVIGADLLASMAHYLGMIEFMLGGQIDGAPMAASVACETDAASSCRYSTRHG